MRQSNQMSELHQLASLNVEEQVLCYKIQAHHGLSKESCRNPTLANCITILFSKARGSI